jgi:predicted nucleic acid-binding protein
MGVMDGWIAAVAEVYGLVLVTRNAADFAGTLERVASPWTED